jgi:acyl-CoA dehydrogenase
MDFDFSEEQQDLQNLAKQILEGELSNERLREIDAGGDRFDRDLWGKLGEAGLLGVAVPEAQGGLGYGFLEAALVLEQVGRTVAPVPVLASCLLGGLAVATFGTEDQRARWVAPMVAGDVVLTAALVEPANRTPEQPTTTAVPCAETASGTRLPHTEWGDWRLTGVKTCVPAGTVAGAVVVPAAAPDGPALFLVEPTAEGVTIEPQRVTNRDLQAMITLDDTPATLLTDDPTALPWLLERATIGACAQAAGVVGRALELTATYAKERVQFGRPIATFQAVGQRAADGYIDVEATRLVLWQAAWRLAEGLPAATEVRVAAYWAAEAAHRDGHTAVHVHGGTGVDVDHPIHRYLIAARQLELTLGGATDQLLRIGTSLAATTH